MLKCAVKDYSDLVTVVGTMPDTHVGSVLSLEGMWKVDARYGRQFSVEKFEETLPATVYGIEKYLGSGLVKGVGPKFAKKIVETFGKETLNVIEDTPEELLKIPGIGKVRVDRITTSWQEQKEIKNIMLFLQSHEVSTSHATKIFKTYGSESIAIVNSRGVVMGVSPGTVTITATLLSRNLTASCVVTVLPDSTTSSTKPKKYYEKKKLQSIAY